MHNNELNLLHYDNDRPLITVFGVLCSDYGSEGEEGTPGVSQSPVIYYNTIIS